MDDIKAIREQTRLSQAKFAHATGIPVRTLQQWEQGKSSPAPYVVAMLKRQAQEITTAQEEDQRHFIPQKTTWKICIDNPFANCDKVYPIQQRKVRELIDDITSSADVREIRIYGSSVTERCHIGSDIDIYVDAENPSGLTTRAHDFEFDLWTNETADSRLKKEIMDKGVKVYG